MRKITRADFFKTSVPELFFIALAFTAAAILLFVNLGEVYLWQDEAATAVLGERMFKFGKPLGYDGINLITMDQDPKAADLTSGDPQEAVRFYINRGDFKADTTWTGQPWGQFILAGGSLYLFGHNTFAARLPFAAAALVTVILFYFFVRNIFQDRLVAALALIFLITNVYWILHGRQCRYYSLTGLTFILTLMAHNYWLDKGRHGGILFIAAAAALFHVDYGTFWPVVIVLFSLSFYFCRDRIKEILSVGAVLALVTAPFFFYYGLMGRLQVSNRVWWEKLYMNLFFLDKFMMPFVLLIAAAFLFRSRFQKLPEPQRRFLLSGFLIMAFSIYWVPSVAPNFYYRYIVHLTLLTAPIYAWLIVTAFRMLNETKKIRINPGIPAVITVCVVIFISLPTQILSWNRPYDTGEDLQSQGILKPELFFLLDRISGSGRDPNREAIEAIRARAMPDDEILVNYEDIPFMFYTGNRIRGGITCFRCEDGSSSPRFLVLRRSVGFVNWPIYNREKGDHLWKELPVKVPDLPFGNIPDPRFSYTYKWEGSLFIAERQSDSPRDR